MGENGVNGKGNWENALLAAHLLDPNQKSIVRLTMPEGSKTIAGDMQNKSVGSRMIENKCSFCSGCLGCEGCYGPACTCPPSVSPSSVELKYAVCALNGHMYAIGVVSGRIALATVVRWPEEDCALDPREHLNVADVYHSMQNAVWLTNEVRKWGDKILIPGPSWPST